MKRFRMFSIFLVSLLLFASFSQGIGHVQEVMESHIDENEGGKMQACDDDWWPMFQHDTLNTGYSLSNGPETSEITWTFQSNLMLNSPAVTDDCVYIGSNSMTESPFSESYVYCLDLSANLVWKTETTGNLNSMPTVINNKVYVGSDNGNLYCLDAIEGKIVWQQKLGQAVSSPTINNNRVIIESLDGYVYCLDATSGKINWRTSLSIDVLSTPIVVEDKIFVRNYCLDIFTGDIIWSSDVGIVLLSSPTFFENKIYIGSRDEKMYCLNAETGEKLWRFYTGSMSYETAPAVAYGNVYVGNAFGYIYCVNATTGERVWSTKNSARAVSSPVICDGKIYIGSVDNHLYCLDAFSGEKIWDFSSDADFFSSSAIAKDHLFSASGNTLYCFGEQFSSNSDLECSDTLTFSEVKPNEMVSSTFTVANIGESYSQMQWRIESFPEWGEWSFNPNEGMNLTPSDNPVLIDVSVLAPDMKEESFSGEIVVVNEEDPSDVEIVEVVLTTNKKLVRNHPIFSFFERMVNLIYWFS